MIKPFLLSRDNLQEYQHGFVNWHKQPTIEISFVVEGSVDIFLLSKKVTVKKGGGFIIMPGNLHSVMPSSDIDDAVYFTFIFALEILYGKKGRKYLKQRYRLKNLILI